MDQKSSTSSKSGFVQGPMLQHGDKILGSISFYTGRYGTYKKSAQKMILSGEELTKLIKADKIVIITREERDEDEVMVNDFG